MKKKLKWVGLGVLVFLAMVVLIELYSHYIGDRDVAPITLLSPLTRETTDYPYTFAVVGDTRAAFHWRLKTAEWLTGDDVRDVISRKIAELEPAFIINTGDLVYGGSREDSWKDFDKKNAIFSSRRIPYYPVLGNHDYNYATAPALEHYFRHFPQLNGQRWYTFNRGKICFIMLDSNNILTAEEVAQEQKWLLDLLNKAEADPDISFIVPVFHQPPFTNSTEHRPNEIVQARWVPVFEKSPKVKLVFNGHVHYYERFKVNRINYIITGGGGASAIQEHGSKPTEWCYHDEYPPDKPHGQHFCLVTVWSDKLIFKTLHLNSAKDAWEDGDYLEIKATND